MGLFDWTKRSTEDQSGTDGEREPETENVHYEVAIPAEVEPSEDTAVSINPIQLQVQFLETARDLAEAVLEYKGDLASAPASVQADLKTKWVLFEVLLPSFREMHDVIGGDLASMPEPVPTVTKMLPWVVGMGSAWHDVDRDFALRMLDDVQALRPDLDVSAVRNAMYA